jgi:ATP-dependent Clp protease, protease subunit
MSMNNLIPIVVDQTPQGERSYDIFSRLMKERIIVVGEAIDHYVSNRVIASLLYLDHEAKKDIYFYINSPGGIVTDGLAMYDTMKALRSDVVTICVGQACSMGAFLLAGGTHGKRLSLPRSRIMIHQVSSGAEGTVKDLKISVNESDRLNEIIAEIMAANCNQPLAKIKVDIDRDFFMDANEAKAYGIIDDIIDKINY